MWENFVSNKEAARLLEEGHKQIVTAITCYTIKHVYIYIYILTGVQTLRQFEDLPFTFRLTINEVEYSKNINNHKR